MRLIFVLIGFLLVAPVWAQNLDESFNVDWSLEDKDWKLYTGAWSLHWEKIPEGHREFESVHNLISVQYGIWQVGHYINSYTLDTFFAGVNLEWKLHPNIEAALGIGVNYGYTDCIHGNEPGRLIEDETKEICGYLHPALFYTEYVIQPGLTVSLDMIALTVRWEFQ